MFPSTLSTFTDPNPTQKLNSPSQSSVVTALNDAVEQIEKVIGLEGGASASTLGTIIGDLKNPTSPGGGHVQTAIKGGTGQTTYTKGDLLVAQSASVLGKLAVGTNNQILVADTSASSGIKWTTDSTPRVLNISSVLTVKSTTSEGSLLSATIVGSTLLTGNAVRGRAFISEFHNGDSAQHTCVLRAVIGGGVVASVAILNSSNNSYGSVRGVLEFNVIASTLTAQSGIFLVDLSSNNPDPFNPTSVKSVRYTGFGVSSVESSADNLFGITATWDSSVASTIIRAEAGMVEKIT